MRIKAKDAWEIYVTPLDIDKHSIKNQIFAKLWTHAQRANINSIVLLKSNCSIGKAIVKSWGIPKE